jgi:hypothetical protein
MQTYLALQATCDLLGVVTSYMLVSLGRWALAHQFAQLGDDLLVGVHPCLCDFVKVFCARRRTSPEPHDQPVKADLLQLARLDPFPQRVCLALPCEERAALVREGRREEAVDDLRPERERPVSVAARLAQTQSNGDVAKRPVSVAPRLAQTQSDGDIAERPVSVAARLAQTQSKRVF